jgi:hypothetical protein
LKFVPNDQDLRYHTEQHSRDELWKLQEEIKRKGQKQIQEDEYARDMFINNVPDD